MNFQSSLWSVSFASYHSNGQLSVTESAESKSQTGEFIARSHRVDMAALATALRRAKSKRGPPPPARRSTLETGSLYHSTYFRDAHVRRPESNTETLTTAFSMFAARRCCISFVHLANDPSRRPQPGPTSTFSSAATGLLKLSFQSAIMIAYRHAGRVRRSEKRII